MTLITVVVVACRDGAVVRALASHQCGPGSIPKLGVEFRVLYSAPRGFLSGYYGFPLSQKKMLFLKNEQMNKGEITILSARDTTRPGFQAGASWVAVWGYINKRITRDCHPVLRTNRVIYFIRFAFQLGWIGCSIFFSLF